MRLAAFSIHLLTAFGGVCAFEALVAFAGHEPERGFWWLGLALAVDGIDGPLARSLGVKQLLPHLSGDVLDLVVDFLTYVFVPTAALLFGHYLTGSAGHALAAGIVTSSLLYFADTRMKDSENRFVGFPALWNVVAFYVVALHMTEAWTAGTVAACIALTFVPLRWLHPLRVRELRPLTLVVTAAWAVACCAALWQGLPAASWSKAVLVLSLLYWVAVSAFWAWRDGLSR